MSAMEYQGPERRRGGPDRRLPGDKTTILGGGRQPERDGSRHRDLA